MEPTPTRLAICLVQFLYNPAWLNDIGPVSDWGPYPATMASRNSFRGPGAWNVDTALSKTFPIHEQVNLVFRAEGFNVFNHHNLYIQEGLNDVANTGEGLPIPVIASKGGIGNNGGQR